MLYRGEYFPSVDAITQQMDRTRHARAEAKQMAEAEKAKQDIAAIEEFKKAHCGKTPTQIFFEENPDILRKLDMNLQIGPTAKSQVKADSIALYQAKALRGGATGEAR
jgi:hypothetical protein